jgi:hypothetical protein
VAAATIWRVILKPTHHGLHFRPRAVVAAAVAFVVVFYAMFSGFFTQPKAPLDAVLAYFHYTRRASGGVHDHAWNYYLTILTWWRAGRGPVWTEGAIVALAVVGFLFAVFRKPAATHPPDVAGAPPAEPPVPRWHHSIPIYPPFVRFMGFYTLFLVIGFSVIPYKTPWCLLGFLHGMIVLAGFACGQVIHVIRHPAGRVLAGVVFAVAAGHLAWEADRATNNFLGGDVRQRDKFAASAYNPYVYAHTGNDIYTFTRRMAEIARVSPEGERTYVQVVTGDMWPIPFYLRAFSKVGYWQDPPAELNGDVIIGTDEVWDRLNAEGAGRRYQASSFGLRPGVVLWIFVEDGLWQKLRELWQSRSPGAGANGAR